MKKIIIIALIMLWLTSCAETTQQERINRIKQCEELWFGYRLSWGKIFCNKEKTDKVFDCIKEYTNWLDEKYNNPDTVSDLREDNYSQVVKTCNETFGNISITK